MAENVVLVERIGAVTVVTLNRPEKLNAMDRDLTRELHQAIAGVGESDARVLVITGAGRGFCSGADVGDIRNRTEGKGEGPTMSLDWWLKGRSIVDFAPRLQELPQPVIAAVNGVAAGAGLTLALAADIRIASDQARFSSLFIRRSLTPDAGVSYLLPRLVGPGLAAEMALTGAMYDASWCASVGLVNRVVPHDRLLPEALALADTIAANPPIAARVTKQVLQRGLHSTLQQAIDNESYYNTWLVKTDDSREAVAAFFEKRSPVFKGR
ncbi:MAG: hypothetical protein EXR51_00740 [Dehalococcoidia bacterium]|nr:hypothetical protein [Dehalococcoidia bacterium]